MPRNDSYNHPSPGAGSASNVPANTNAQAIKSSPSTTVKSSLTGDSNGAEREHVLGTHLAKMPDTSDDLERNWLTATATPIFSRAGLPHVVMPVRADSRKSKGRPHTTSSVTSASATTASRGGGEAVVPNYSETRKMLYVAAEEARSSSNSPDPEVVMQNNQQNLSERRLIAEDGSKRTIASRDHIDGDGKDTQMPFSDSSKFTGGFTKLRRVLSFGGTPSDEPMSLSSIQLQAHDALIDNKDDIERSEPKSLPLPGESGRSDKRWQFSSIFKLFSGGPNKGSKLT